MITKRQLLETFGSGAMLAAQLGISRSAVAKWPMDDPIPVLRELQLKTLFPEFGNPAAVIKRGFKTEYAPPGRPEARP